MKHLTKKTHVLAVLLLELLVLLFLLAKSVFGPGTHMELLGTDFSADLCSHEFALRSGGYLVTAEYTINNENAPDVCILIESHERDSITDFEPLLLDRAHTEVAGRLYVPLFSSVHDLQILIDTDAAPSDISIYRVNIQEKKTYRFIQFIKVFLALLIIDAFIYFVFLSPNDELSAGRFFGDRNRIILLGVFIFASLPLFSNYLYMGHDLIFHLDRIDSLAVSMRNGHLRQYIQAAMINGYGCETPLFYCDLFLYPTAFLYEFCLLPMRQCYQLYIVFVNILTMYFSYRLFENIFSNEQYGMIGMALYTLNIYRLEDLYLRSAAGEYTAMIFIPLVIEGIYRIYKEKEPTASDWLPLSLGMTCLLLSHTVTFEMAIILLVLFIILMIPNFSIRRLFSIFSAALCAILLCLWFIVPLVDSMITLHPVLLDKSYRIQWTGAYLFQLFDPIPSGTGINAYGTYEDLPLSIGAGLSLGFFVVLFLQLRKRLIDKTVCLAFAFASLTLWMSSYYFPWDMIEKVFGGRIDTIVSILESVEFVWHYLEFAILFLSIALVGALAYLRTNNIRLFKPLVLAVVSLSLVSDVFFYHDFILHTQQRKYNSISNNDRLSQLTEDYDLKPGMHDIDVYDTTVHASSPNIDIISYYSNQGDWLLECANAGPKTDLLLPLFDYANYHAFDISSGEELSLSRNPDNMRLSLAVPSYYSGTIIIQYIPPRFWCLSEIISIASLLSLCVYILIKRLITTCRFRS